MISIDNSPNLREPCPRKPPFSLSLPAAFWSPCLKISGPHGKKSFGNQTAYLGETTKEKKIIINAQGKALSIFPWMPLNSMEEFEVIMVKAAIITGNGINSDIELGRPLKWPGQKVPFSPSPPFWSSQNYSGLSYSGLSRGLQLRRPHRLRAGFWQPGQEKPPSLSWKTLSKPKSSSSASATAFRSW
jgi:hypothetical protein